MCGIVGQLRLDGSPVDPAHIQAMCDAVAHRGPDGEGKHVSGSVGLGHRRLAIIDLQGGAQPMATPDDQVWVTFNGEIYNFKELRAELEGAGVEFRTNSDTEVLLHGWRQWGDRLVPKLRGMFAFCLVDYDQRKWLLARDPFGIKPLFYRHGDGVLEFSSELHALKSVRGRLEAVEWFLRYQYVPNPYTIFHDVWKLPPAHFMQGTLDGKIGEPVRYWRMDFIEQRGVSETEWLERLDSALHDSVQAHLIADVPVGLLLSGGVDSTLVAREMAELTGGSVKAFTMDFDVEGFGELEYAKQAADRYGIELVHDTQSDDFWDELPELVRHYGEPFGDNSLIPTWRVTKLAREHVPVVLGGDGGDEGFGGYKFHGDWLKRPETRKRRKRFFMRPSIRHLKSLLWAHMRRMGSDWNNAFDWELLVGYTQLDAWRKRNSRRLLWKSDFLPLTDRPSPAFEGAANLIGRAHRLDFAQEMDFLTYLPGAILPKSDVASMYHGLEVRTPFLDYRVLEVASALPANLRANVEDGERNLKILLRKSLERDFSPDFVYRGKKGFGIPRARWFARSARGRAFIEGHLLDSSAGLGDWFDMNLVRQMLAEQSDEQDHSAILWLLLVLAIWKSGNPGVVWS
ncbi:MAG: asparagine synthase (glutamine-hydrolyzing) [Planctomycetes bacterium]|nr:asparagine synthase (glutamine-hydrolyzing) [Planctomycetota bacterium]